MRKKLPVGPLLFKFCSRLLFLSVLLCAGQLVAQPLSGIYTINNTLITGARNFKTFQDASNALVSKGVSAPVVFSIPANSTDFTEQVSFYYTPGASATNTITFEGNGNTIKFRSQDPASMAVIKLDGASHFIFDSLKVTATVLDFNDYGVGFQLLRDADSNIVRKCNVTIVGDPSVYVNQHSCGFLINGTDAFDLGYSYCDGNLITGNTVTGGNNAVFMTSWRGNVDPSATPPNTDYTVTGKLNKFTNNVFKDFDEIGVKIEQSSGTVIQGNTFTGVSRDGLFNGAIQLSGYSTQTFVLENKILNITGAASGIGTFNCFSVSECPTAVAGKENLIANNVVSLPNANFAVVAFSVGYSSQYVRVYHNSVYINGTNGGEADCFYFDSYGTNPGNNNFYNNIFSIAGNFSSIYGIQCNSSISVIPANTSFNRNDYYLAGTGTIRMAKFPTSLTYNTMDLWRAATLNDMSSVQINPLFENTATGVLKPTEKRLDNRGNNLGIDKDITGATRNATTPDIGAYEFNLPCTTPVVPGAAAVSPTTVCETTVAGLDLTGNSAGDGQTYQWMSSATETGTYTNVGTAVKSPALEVTATTTLYYKAMVTCGTDTKPSTPVLLMVNPILPAGVYTINSKQPAGNRNYTSFANALQALSCGISGPVEFVITNPADRYTEQVIATPIKGASAINTITFNGNGDTLAFTATSSARRGTIMLNNAKYFTFKNFVLEANAAANAIGVLIYNNSDSNAIRNCKIALPVARYNANTIGIAMGSTLTSTTVESSSNLVNCNYNTIDSCTIVGGYWGIICYGPSALASASTGNSITNNKLVDFASFGIYTQGQKNLKISGNDMSRPTVPTLIDFNPTGVYIKYSPGATISENKIHNLHDGVLTSTKVLYGINVENCDATAAIPNVVKNNVVYNFANKGDHYGLNNNNSDYTYFYHNSVSLIDQVLVTKLAIGCNVASATGAQVKNNILVVRRNVSTKSYAIAVPTTGVSLANNNYYVDLTNSVIFTGKWGTSGSFDRKQLADWQSASASGETTSQAIDPKFEAVATGNLKPTEATLKNKGVGVGIVRDILGLRRNTTTPDVGAYEFACVNPADPTALNAGQICKDSAAILNVKDPVTGVVYKWYDTSFFPARTEGTEVGSGIQFVSPALPKTVTYYLEAIAGNGCGSGVRVPVTTQVLNRLAKPVVKADQITAESVRFTWQPVPDATGYLVSRNRTTFTAPSPNPTGLTHLVTGLKGGDTLSLVVKATAILECQSNTSDSAFARTLTYTFFVPNMFTPNGDGKNDEFRVYGNTIASLKLMVFNQWGQKVYEGNDKFQGWKGTFGGEPQPVGVYIYVAQISFTNGTTQTTKGTLSLIR